MARIRSIKPDFFASEDVSVLPLRARLTWIGLWLHCDDHGRHKDIARLIKGRIWSMDDVSLRDVEEDLETLAKHGRIVRYVVNEKAFLAITNWHHHQAPPKPSPPKHPSPTVPVGVPEPSERGHCSICWDNDQNCRSRRVSPSSGSPTEPLPEDYPQEGKGIRNKEREGSVGEAADGDEPRPDVERLCARLADRIETNGSKRPTVTQKWRDAARLIIDRDGHTEQQVAAAIDWCQSDEFWRANVLSMPKLREKYDQMRLQSERRNGNRRQAETDEMFDRAMARAQAREVES